LNNSLLLFVFPYDGFILFIFFFCSGASASVFRSISRGGGPSGCISERLVKGGTGSVVSNPGHTGCDWITTLRDPIANDPTSFPIFADRRRLGFDFSKLSDCLPVLAECRFRI